MNRYLAKLASLDEKRAYPSNPQNPQNPPQRGFEGFEGSPSSAFLQLVTPPTELSAEPYASALASLRAKCPPYVPEDRWRQAIADATTFATKWGAEAQALGWTASELFGLHPVPEQPAPYDRLARLDDLGLIWLLRGRPVTVLTSTEAVILCHSGATLKFYRRTATATPATEIADGVEPIGKPTPAAEITGVTPAAEIDKAAPARIIDAAKQGLGDALKPARTKADAANHAETKTPRSKESRPVDRGRRQRITVRDGETLSSFQVFIICAGVATERVQIALRNIAGEKFTSEEKERMVAEVDHLLRKWEGTKRKIQVKDKETAGFARGATP
jgi:hypothetical protein